MLTQNFVQMVTSKELENLVTNIKKVKNNSSKIFNEEMNTPTSEVDDICLYEEISTENSLYVRYKSQFEYVQKSNITN